MIKPGFQQLIVVSLRARRDCIVSPGILTVSKNADHQGCEDKKNGEPVSFVIPEVVLYYFHLFDGYVCELVSTLDELIHMKLIYRIANPFLKMPISSKYHWG